MKEVGEALGGPDENSSLGGGDSHSKLSFPLQVSYSVGRLFSIVSNFTL